MPEGQRSRGRSSTRHQQPHRVPLSAPNRRSSARARPGRTRRTRHLPARSVGHREPRRVPQPVPNRRSSDGARSRRASGVRTAGVIIDLAPTTASATAAGTQLTITRLRRTGRTRRTRHLGASTRHREPPGTAVGTKPTITSPARPGRARIPATLRGDHRSGTGNRVKYGCRSRTVDHRTALDPEGSGGPAGFRVDHRSGTGSRGLYHGQFQDADHERLDATWTDLDRLARLASRRAVSRRYAPRCRPAPSACGTSPPRRRGGRCGRRSSRAAPG
jgi:hypothetical protein